MGGKALLIVHHELQPRENTPRKIIFLPTATSSKNLFVSWVVVTLRFKGTANCISSAESSTQCQRSQNNETLTVCVKPRTPVGTAATTACAALCTTTGFARRESHDAVGAYLACWFGGEERQANLTHPAIFVCLRCVGAQPFGFPRIHGGETVRPYTKKADENSTKKYKTVLPSCKPACKLGHVLRNLVGDDDMTVESREKSTPGGCAFMALNPNDTSTLDRLISFMLENLSRNPASLFCLNRVLLIFEGIPASLSVQRWTSKCVGAMVMVWSWEVVQGFCWSRLYHLPNVE